jgi:LysM repeat protein
MMVLVVGGCGSIQPERNQLAAQTGPVVKVSPAESQVNVGGTTTLEIRVENVVNLYAVDIELKFDQTRLQVQDADPNKDSIQIAPGDFLKLGFVEGNDGDNSTGVVHYVATQTAPSPPVSGNGLLASITFEGTALGNSDLIFSSVALVGLNGTEVQPISADVQSGRVVVIGETGQITPTAVASTTPSPTTVASTTPSPTAIPSTTPSPTAVASMTPTPTSTDTPPPNPSTATPILTPPPPPIPPVTEIPPGATLGFCYRVQTGETLASLSAKFGVSAGFINLVNDLSPPYKIYPQQTLFMPSTESGRGPNVYIAQEGDTLAGIGEKCHLPASFLAFVNELEVDEEAPLSVGHVLLIPIPPFAPPSRYSFPAPCAGC